MPRPEAGALAPLIRPLPEAAGGVVRLDGDVRLALAPAAIGRERLMTQARATAGEAISRSRADQLRGVAIAPSGRVGLDLETLARVAANTGPGDVWLVPAEARTVATTDDGLLELAARWVLKEAYAKALGLGLAMPFAAVAFGGADGTIAPSGPFAPPADERWRFTLHRRGDLLVATAHLRRPQAAAIPFAPFGRKPPGPPVDRYSPFRI